ncbi:S8 family serine peptidase [Pseudanabaena sp. FACHB-1998]|uniref:S8 family serine peptidase n=1 Tax=Pseudanabaena sp. FACHB-1998 TaxID=2692858 RepID=UPI00168067B9|nr:S8 family serine peptidase [Pseudanabaena sp. FACHB-1998]MBD2178425.1 S8 family serine peptidase [Pseudanabaena sp. FACHB-1998]
MSQSNRPESSQTIYAQAVVRPENGDSLLSHSVFINSKNVSDFHVVEGGIKLVAQKLLEAGFEIVDFGKMAITISGNTETFEREFQTKLEAVERSVIKGDGKNSTATFINAVDSKPFGEIDVSKTSWHQFLVGVAINEPVYYFQSNQPTSAPPLTIYDSEYLSVPDGVAQGVNAHLAHQQGIRGKGIHVVMVDSGWYPHPYFAKHKYNVQVRLASGSSDREVDLSGHGTGESANLLAIAPEIKLTMVKADVALGGKGKNVNSIGALREAIALQPDIISCSWGSDERKGEISPYNRVLAATVSEAIRRGIIVIFSAGNGQWGFPGQHPEVTAAGGAFIHLNGSLKGKIEASSYASSFVSRIYPNRQVPDVCGLVGQLPHGSYIMLPVPPGCEADRGMALARDGTEERDGWAAFSGTSAAAPQLAGICALMKQVNPKLTPAQAKKILEDTARDAVDGSSNPSSSGASATKGFDLATGFGLADANLAVNAAKALTSDACCDDCASPSSQNFSTTSPSSLPKKVSKPMASEFPKLKKKLDLVLWEIEKTLQNKLKDLGIEDEIDLVVTEDDFVERSVVAKVSYSYRQLLYGDKTADGGEIVGCFDDNGKVDSSKINETHIAAAQTLFNLGRDQEAAIQVFTSALMLTAVSKKDIRKLASDALSACSSKIRGLDSSGGRTVSNFFDKQTIKTCNDGWKACDVQGNTATCDGNTTYTKRRGEDCWS